MAKKKLTTLRFWEEYWDNKYKVPAFNKQTLLQQELLKIFNKYLIADASLKVLEIGGAPGDYLLYMLNQFNYSVYSLDYSSIGNQRTIETFNEAGQKVEVFEKDLFSNNLDLPLFDIVYSLGFIEHFDDPTKVIDKHLSLLKPGGILMLGVPNLTGVYHFFLKFLSPSHDKSHNLKIMDINNWGLFEKEFGLEPVFRSYIGGFEPLIMKKRDVHTPLTWVLHFIVKVLMVIFSFRLKFLRKFNSRFWSGYIIGVYRKPIG